MDTQTSPPGLETALDFPLIQALHGRRARRFSAGAVIPDGPLAFKSALDPQPLSDLETMIVLTSAAGQHGLALRDHPQRDLRPALPELRGRRGRAARSRRRRAST